jgi:hypothetical protein
VQLLWILPPQSSLNGIVRGFKVYYQNADGSSPKIKNYLGNVTLQYVLDGLEKFTNYSFLVLAYTIKDGPYSNIATIQTEQDGK